MNLTSTEHVPPVGNGAVHVLALVANTREPVLICGAALVGAPVFVTVNEVAGDGCPRRTPPKDFDVGESCSADDGGGGGGGAPCDDTRTGIVNVAPWHASGDVDAIATAPASVTELDELAAIGHVPT